MFYFYEVLNKGGQKFQGVIGAESETAAREKLASMGLTVQKIEENKGEREGVAGLFNFKAQGTDGGVVKGTIEAASEQAANQRLQSDFGLKVFSLWPSTEGQPAVVVSQKKEGWGSDLRLFSGTVLFFTAIYYLVLTIGRLGSLAAVTPVLLYMTSLFFVIYFGSSLPSFWRRLHYRGSRQLIVWVQATAFFYLLLVGAAKLVAFWLTAATFNTLTDLPLAFCLLCYLIFNLQKP